MSKINSVIINQNLINDLSSELEEVINVVCEKYPNLDPRLELLLILGMFCTQVGIDCGYNKKDFINLIAEMFDDSVEFDKLKKENNDISNLN